MNKINPLYILVLLGTIFFLSFYILNESIYDFNKKNHEYNNIQIKAKEYKDFRTTWNNKKYATNVINQILKNSSFTNQKILRVDSQNSIKIKIQSNEQKILDNFLNKILNKKLILKKLELSKRYINLEIGFKL